MDAGNTSPTLALVGGLTEMSSKRPGMAIGLQVPARSGAPFLERRRTGLDARREEGTPRPTAARAVPCGSRREPVTDTLARHRAGAS